MENKQHVKREIHRLMQVCEDSARSYRNAADHIDDSDVKSTLYKIATERTKFIGELQDDVRQLGIDPLRTGSPGATLRRIMINVKAALRGIQAKEILDLCEKGEKTIMKTYERMLRDDPPEFIKERLSSQHKSIVEAWGRVKMLEKKLADGHG